MSPRKRGAQPANTNALRHGFYSRYLRQEELDDLDNYDMSSYASEVAMLRAAARRLLELGDGIDDLDKAMALLNTLGLAAYRVANMIYKNKMMSGEQDNPISSTLSQALSEITKEVKLR